MFGKGLLQGLKITLGWFFRPKVTVQYPEQRLPLPERFIGKPEFDYDKCTACNQCVMACPNQVIKLNTETADKKRILTQYDFDQQYCMFCGMCEEACPKDAIKFTKDFELTRYNRPDIKIKFVKPEHIEKKREEIKKLMQEQAAQALKEPEKPSNVEKSEQPKGTGEKTVSKSISDMEKATETEKKTIMENVDNIEENKNVIKDKSVNEKTEDNNTEKEMAEKHTTANATTVKEVAVEETAEKETLNEKTDRKAEGE